MANQNSDAKYFCEVLHGAIEWVPNCEEKSLFIDSINLKNLTLRVLIIDPGEYCKDYQQLPLWEDHFR